MQCYGISHFFSALGRLDGYFKRGNTNKGAFLGENLRLDSKIRKGNLLFFTK